MGLKGKLSLTEAAVTMILLSGFQLLTLIVNNSRFLTAQTANNSSSILVTGFDVLTCSSHEIRICGTKEKLAPKTCAPTVYFSNSQGQHFLGYLEFFVCVLLFVLFSEPIKDSCFVSPLEL